MKSKINFSIIILTYNRKEDLKETLNSVFSQTRDDFEVIIVNQGSSDGTNHLLQNFNRDINIISLNKNIGVAPGRNLGASKALGKYLIFIDDDASFQNSNILNEVERVFINEKIGAIAFKIVNYYTNDLSNFGYPSIMKKYAKDDISFYCSNFIGCGNAIRRKLFVKLGMFNDNYFFWGEEGEFSIRLYSETDYFIIYSCDIVIRHKVSPEARLTWENGRFYFKVLHRLDMVLNLYRPLSRKIILLLFWISVLFIQAFKYLSLKDYFKAIISTNYRLLFKSNTQNNFSQYVKIRRNMYFPLICKNIIFK